jgi:hypothetical protein
MEFTFINSMASLMLAWEAIVMGLDTIKALIFMTPPW